MQTSGSGSILVGVGLATLAPVLLRLARAGSPPAGRPRRAAGHLAAHNTARRAHLLAGVLAPGHRVRRRRRRHADAGRHRRPHPRRRAPDAQRGRHHHAAQLRRHRDDRGVRRHHGGQRPRRRDRRTAARSWTGCGCSAPRRARSRASVRRRGGARRGHRGRAGAGRVAGHRRAVRDRPRRGPVPDGQLWLPPCSLVAAVGAHAGRRLGRVRRARQRRRCRDGASAR